MKNTRFRVNANGAEVMIAGKWLPADAKVLKNCMEMLKDGLPDRPEFELCK
jgi:hypothetical protein